MSLTFRYLFLCLLLSGPTGASTYFVSTAGHDQGSGSMADPFASIQRGIDQLEPGDGLIIRGGSYFETPQVNHSGNASHPITIQAQPGESVILAGTKPLVGPWIMDSRSIYKTTWPSQPNQVFCDGRLLNEARWPKAEVEGLSHQRVAIAEAGSPTFTACSSLPPVDLTGALIQIMPGQSWCGYTRSIESENKEVLAFSSPISEMAAILPRKGDRFFVFGKKDLLTGPGEWWWDSIKQELYVWTPDGKNPMGRVEAGIAPCVLSLDRQSYVVVQNLNARGGWFSLHNSDHCVVQNCNLNAPNWTREVDGYRVQPTLLGGADISGSDNQWQGGSIRFAGRCGILVQGLGQTIQGVTVEDCGWNWGSEGGIQLNDCDGCVVKDCIVKRIARMGIYLLKSTDCKILHNFVEDPLLYSNDGGDFYTWGTDGKGTEIAYNRFGRNQSIWGAGLYLDDNCKNFYAHGNLISDQAWNGISFKEVNRIENNTVLDAGHQGISIFPPAATSLKGGLLAHNQVPETFPIRIALASPSVKDWGYFGAYAYLSKGPRPGGDRLESIGSGSLGRSNSIGFNQDHRHQFWDGSSFDLPILGFQLKAIAYRQNRR